MLQKIYVTLVTSTLVPKDPEFGYSDVGSIYHSKEEAEKDLERMDYKKVDRQKDIYEKLAGNIRHRYKIVEKYIY